MSDELFTVRVSTSLGSFDAKSSDFLASSRSPNPIAALVLGFIRPKVQIDTPIGGKTLADHGEPLSPIVGWAIVIGFVAGLVVIVRKL